VADPGLLRKRLRTEIDAARKAAAARRARSDRASRAYETFLESVAVPAFRTIANILRAEGIPFDAHTPSNAVRLVSARFRDDAIEIVLDPALDPPQPVLVSSRTRGSRTIRSERPVKAGVPIESITEDEVIEQLFQELRPWLE
jgi:hypothetical protein